MDFLDLRLFVIEIRDTFTAIWFFLCACAWVCRRARVLGSKTRERSRKRENYKVLSMLVFLIVREIRRNQIGAFLAEAGFWVILFQITVTGILLKAIGNDFQSRACRRQKYPGVKTSYVDTKFCWLLAGGEGMGQDRTEGRAIKKPKGCVRYAKQLLFIWLFISNYKDYFYY